MLANRLTADDWMLSAMMAYIEGDKCNIPKESVEVIFEAIKEALSDKERKLLIHREYLDEEVPGLLAGYLIYSKLLEDPILARTILERILAKPLSPKAISFIPSI